MEIRRASSYLVGTSFNDTFDTNDRHTQAFRIEALDGSDIADGDTFTLTDGIHQLTFEFNDEAAAPTVTPGHFEIAFNSEMRSWEVAIRIRDAINRPEVFAVLDVTAALSDGTDGLRFADWLICMEMYISSAGPDQDSLTRSLKPPPNQVK